MARILEVFSTLSVIACLVCDLWRLDVLMRQAWMH